MNEKVEFKCQRCSRIYLISKQAWYQRKKDNNFVCRSCHTSESIKRHWENMPEDKKKRRSEKLSKNLKCYFDNLSSVEKKNLSDKAKESYNNLSENKKNDMRNKQKKYWSNLSKEEKEKWSKSKRDYYINLSEEDKIIYSERIKEGWKNKPQKEKDEFSQMKKEWYHNLPDDVKENIANQSRERWFNNEELRKNIELGYNKWWNSLSDKDKENHAKRTKDLWDKMNEEDRKKFIKQRVQWYYDLSDEERKEFIRKSHQWYHELSKEEKEKISHDISARNKIRWDDMNDEDRKKFSEKIKDSWKNLSNEERIKRSQKIRDWHANLSDEDKRKRTKKILMSTNGFNGFNQRFESEFNKLYFDYYFKQEEVVINHDVIHSWDYAIYNRNNDLILLVDLDGKYFHADECDYDGIHSKLEYDEKRGRSIPDGVKWCIIYEKDFDKSFEYMCSLLGLSYDEFVNKRFNEYRSMPFPYPEYTDAELLHSYRDLCKLNCDDKYHKSLNVNTRIGDRLIQHFHRSLYDNIIKTWNNDDVLRNMIKDGYLYHSYLNKNKILQGFNIYEPAQRVSILSAGKAKMIIHRYLSEYDEVFNPCYNYGGIMLACIAMNKRYIGICNDDIQRLECDNMLSFLRDNGIDMNVSFDDKRNEYQCLFAEVYDNKMIDEYLSKYKCQRYLFIIDNDIKYIDDIEEA